MTSITVTLRRRGTPPARPGSTLAVTALLCALLSGCAVYTQTVPMGASPAPSATGPRDGQKQKDLFVFFDGTSNDPRSATNVWRLFEQISKSGDSSARSIYIEGVGNARNPLTGMLLGYGMEKRLGLAYRFLAAHYQPGDRIRIFGFSRGAHQARALAGLLAYSGLPAADSRKLGGRASNRIREITKSQKDQVHEEGWKTWTQRRPPPLAREIHERTHIAVQPVTIEFLGVWDTVPGSLFKDFRVGACKELLEPEERSGERYKSDSYPPIRRIAHALAHDEKRSRFRPLLVCPPIEHPTEPTRVRQVWFPGAHSDVGGGYADPDPADSTHSLSNISFNWMVQQLAESYRFSKPFAPLPESVDGLAHWSIGKFPGNFLSRCEDRHPAPGHDQHPAIAERGRAPAPLLMNGIESEVPYPKLCPTEQE